MQNPKYAMGPVCAEGAQIVYAWAMDAPQLSMPKGNGQGSQASDTWP